MKKDLQYIREKISDIQFGILKLRDVEGNKAWQVKTRSDEASSLHIVVTDECPCDELVNRNVNLVQKHKDDYLYITGRVSAEANRKSKVLSIDILKACWFVRTTKGKVSWLKQKYLYENLPLIEMELAS